MNTEKNRVIRKNPQELDSGNDLMITTKKLCSLQNQRQKELVCKISMNNKLIEVKYVHTVTKHDDYYNGTSSWLEYDTLGFFDNIQDAWDVVQFRIKKYHTKTDDYSFSLVEVNPTAENIPATFYEESSLSKYHQDIEKEKQRKIDEQTLGFRCSECKKIIKMSYNIEGDKTEHAKTKHIRNASWAHVNWIRVMKKSKGGDKTEV